VQGASILKSSNIFLEFDVVNLKGLFRQLFPPCRIRYRVPGFEGFNFHAFPLNP